PDEQYILTNNIEAGRIEDEETGELPFEIRFMQWDEEDPAELLRGVVTGRVGSDAGYGGAEEDVASDFARLRRQLMEPEIERYREVGRIASEVIASTCREIEPGMTEHEIAGELMGRAFAAGCQPVVALIAADERAFRYRHPIPTDHVLREHVMVVLGCSKWGLGISATRMVSFGQPDAEMRDKHAACCYVDACLNLETRPGAAVSEVFRKAVAAYQARGYPEEWRLHHQGGATGYAAREYKGTLDCEETVLERQAFAWNPSITGTKSEDTIIATGDGPEFLSTGADWPTLEVEYEGVTVERMDILVR
ncbi:MAG: M24 family metallopeptidase, partial [Armatimonadetes bacterium]|nr:M24 family metallopeptidase [Armatimonadota bacterium]